MILKAIKEKRFITLSDKGLNVRSEQTEAGERYITGYAALYNHDSKLIAEYRNNKPIAFIERILPGAFDEALESKSLNVIHTIDHDRTKMLARTASGTLQLTTDEKGLMYRFSVPNTTLGNDLFEMVKRGDMYESSFVFTLDEAGEKWEQRDGQHYRTISKVSGLYDTSTVTDGAYSATEVKIGRSLEDLTEKVEAEPVLEQQPVSEADLIELQTVLFSNI